MRWGRRLGIASPAGTLHSPLPGRPQAAVGNDSACMSPSQHSLEIWESVSVRPSPSMDRHAPWATFSNVNPPLNRSPGRQGGDGRSVSWSMGNVNLHSLASLPGLVPAWTPGPLFTLPLD